MLKTRKNVFNKCLKLTLAQYTVSTQHIETAQQQTAQSNNDSQYQYRENAMRGSPLGARVPFALSHPYSHYSLTVWCSGNALVSINAVALHRARLVQGWVAAFGQVSKLSH